MPNYDTYTKAQLEVEVASDPNNDLALQELVYANDLIDYADNILYRANNGDRRGFDNPPPPPNP